MFDTEQKLERCSLANTDHCADRTIGAFHQANRRRMNPHKVFEGSPLWRRLGRQSPGVERRSESHHVSTNAFGRRSMRPINASLGGRVYPVVGPPNCTRTCDAIQLPRSPAIESARCFRSLWA